MVALVLAFLAVARISFSGGPHVVYRTPNQWASSSTIYITQKGFALGRSVFDQVAAVPGSGGTSYVPLVSDPARFGSYSVVLAEIANSDAVRKIMNERGPVSGVATATPVSLPDAPTSSLPFVRILGVATTQSAAVTTTKQATAAVLTYVRRQSNQARIPVEKRVVLSVLESPHGASLLKGRSKTRPLFIFIAAMSAVIGLAFILENLRPRLRLVSEQRSDDRANSVGSSRHSA